MTDLAIAAAITGFTLFTCWRTRARFSKALILSSVLYGVCFAIAAMSSHLHT